MAGWAISPHLGEISFPQPGTRKLENPPRQHKIRAFHTRKITMASGERGKAVAPLAPAVAPSGLGVLGGVFLGLKPQALCLRP